ncbi:MAG: fluoride efflux transporter CrcB [Cellvibrionales bacterium]|nr:fluoride efflux transporter CrcB [Cellvibrionales bacterium]|tara:strand:+ start:46582 stop:46983 length:402 start_codon:yes stop_codon:yes gene_type:complete
MQVLFNPINVTTLVAVASGGAIGAILRYAINVWFVTNYSSTFPWPTLIANAIGALFIGILYVLIAEKGLVAVTWRPFLVIGLLGALTTFSSFSLETITLIEQAEWFLAVVYMLSSVLLCIMLTWLGITLTRIF